MTKIEQDLVKSIDNMYSAFDTYGTIQIGRYIIQPIYWSKDEDNNVNTLDKESVIDEFLYFTESEVCFDFLDYEEKQDDLYD